jgi:hypothetical protein
VTKIVGRLVSVAAVATTLAIPAALATPVAHAAEKNPPALWYKTSGSPTDAEITAAATRYSVVILNPWETAALRKLKALNPTITVLAYKCLSSTRSYSGAVINGQDAAVLPTGVGYVEANSAHPEWFATDTSGNRVQWGSYPGHWQMAVWNAGYQARWATNVANEMVASGFDGVLADNALTRMRSSYFTGTLAGAPTKEALQAGERALLAAAGAKLHAVGKLLVPNISEARLYPGLWADWTGLGDGGMEENYAHWGTNPDDVGSYLWDWGSNGWSAVQNQLTTPGLNLAVTRSVDSDNRSYRYGLASFLIGGGGKGAFEAVDDYRKAPLRPEQAWQLGAPTTGVARVGAAYTRTFASGFAAVNPSSTATVTVPVPAGMVDASGASVTSVTLGPLTGSILKLAAGTGTTTTDTTTTSPSKKKWRHYAVTAPLTTATGTTGTAGTAKASASVTGKTAANAVTATRAATTARRNDRTGATATTSAAATRTAARSTATAATRTTAVRPAAGATGALVATAGTIPAPNAPAPVSGGLVALAAGVTFASATALRRRTLPATA